MKAVVGKGEGERMEGIMERKLWVRIKGEYGEEKSKQWTRD